MINKIKFWMIPILAGSAVLALVQPSTATPTNITCNSSTDTPKVIATISDRGRAKEIAILNFLPQYFSPTTAVQNCQETAKTLQTLYSSGNANFLTAEKLDRLPVVCSVERRGVGCNHYSAQVLFTLDRADNPSQALYDMLGSDFKGAQPPSPRTVSRIYSDIKPSWWRFW
jgi:hypothetical protein